MTTIKQFLAVSDAYAKATDLAETTISTRVFSAGGDIRRLREGADIGVKRLGRAIDWFAANWPEGVPWPKGIARPGAREIAARETER